MPYIGFLDLAICFYYAYHGEALGEGGRTLMYGARENVEVMPFLTGQALEHSRI